MTRQVTKAIVTIQVSFDTSKAEPEDIEMEVDSAVNDATDAFHKWLSERKTGGLFIDLYELEMEYESFEMTVED